MKIQVKKGGPLTTLQDQGRYGFQKFGVLVSGAMDLFSLKLGNILVGNDEKEAALEMTMSGPFLKVPAGLVFALTGADLSAKLGGKPVPLNRAIYVKEDTTLSFGFAARGARGYLSVAGGFDVPLVMNSKSTYLRAKLGGFGGAPLQDGAELETGTLSAGQEKLAAALAKAGGKPFSTFGWSIPDGNLFATDPIRVTQGLQADWFDNDTLYAFLENPYTITAQSDRMGYRLSGTPLHYKDSSLEMISEPVTFGSIQVPADGNPIILMADRQTTGGYAKIAQVIQADLPRLAQMKPGQKIYFEPVTLTAAEQALERQEQFLADAKAMVKR